MEGAHLDLFCCVNTRVLMSAVVQIIFCFELQKLKRKYFER